jgi:YihY family inner membrane protein
MGSDEPNIASRLVRSIEVRFPTVWRSVGDPALEILRMIRIDQVGVEAGSMTYGALLSIPPFLLLAVTVVERFFSDRPDAAQRLLSAAESAIPGLGELIGSGLRLSPAAVAGAGIVGVLALMWAASGFAVRVRHALGAVFATELLGLVTGRLAAIATGVPVLLLLIAYTAAASWLTTLDVSSLAAVTGDLLAHVVLLAAGVVVWAAVYRAMTPGAEAPSFREHVAGGTAFTIAFLLLERFGAVYVDHVVARSRALYGAIGALFGLLAFLYLAMWLFLLGGEVTKLRRRPVASSP